MMYPHQRSIATAIILSIVTCGIYAFYWLYKMLEAHYHFNNQQSTAGMDILLGIVTCGFYFYYVYYKMGKLESNTYRNFGMPPKDDSILYVILGIFGLAIVTYAIVQDNLNKLIIPPPGGPGPGAPQDPYAQQGFYGQQNQGNQYNQKP